MLALDDKQRNGLRLVGSAMCILATMLAPLSASPSVVAPSAAQGLLRALQRVPPIPKLFGSTVVPVHLARDPFRVPRDARITPVDLVMSNSDGIVGMHVVAGMPMRRGVLSSQDGVEALIVGRRPRALIRVGSTVRIVRVGDFIGGVRVSSIDTSGVRFVNGTLLILQGKRVP